MSKDKAEHVEKITKAIENSDIPEEKKSLAVQKIEEWYAQDQGMELLSAQLNKIAAEIEPILKEIGLL